MADVDGVDVGVGILPDPGPDHPHSRAFTHSPYLPHYDKTSPPPAHGVAWNSSTRVEDWNRLDKKNLVSWRVPNEPEEDRPKAAPFSAGRESALTPRTRTTNMRNRVKAIRTAIGQLLEYSKTDAGVCDELSLVLDEAVATAKQYQASHKRHSRAERTAHLSPTKTGAATTPDKRGSPTVPSCALAKTMRARMAHTGQSTPPAGKARALSASTGRKKRSSTSWVDDEDEEEEVPVEQHQHEHQHQHHHQHHHPPPGPLPGIDYPLPFPGVPHMPPPGMPPCVTPPDGWYGVGLHPMPPPPPHHPLELLQVSPSRGLRGAFIEHSEAGEEVPEELMTPPAKPARPQSAEPWVPSSCPTRKTRRHDDDFFGDAALPRSNSDPLPGLVYSSDLAALAFDRCTPPATPEKAFRRSTSANADEAPRTPGGARTLASKPGVRAAMVKPLTVAATAAAGLSPDTPEQGNAKPRFLGSPALQRAKEEETQAHRARAAPRFLGPEALQREQQQQQQQGGAPSTTPPSQKGKVTPLFLGSPAIDSKQERQKPPAAAADKKQALPAPAPAEQPPPAASTAAAAKAAAPPAGEKATSEQAKGPLPAGPAHDASGEKASAAKAGPAAAPAPAPPAPRVKKAPENEWTVVKSAAQKRLDRERQKAGGAGSGNAPAAAARKPEGKTAKAAQGKQQQQQQHAKATDKPKDKPGGAGKDKDDKEDADAAGTPAGKKGAAPKPETEAVTAKEEAPSGMAAPKADGESLMDRCVAKGAKDSDDDEDGGDSDTDGPPTLCTASELGDDEEALLLLAQVQREGKRLLTAGQAEQLSEAIKATLSPGKPDRSPTVERAKLKLWAASPERPGGAEAEQEARDRIQSKLERAAAKREILAKERQYRLQSADEKILAAKMKVEMDQETRRAESMKRLDAAADRAQQETHKREEKARANNERVSETVFLQKQQLEERAFELRQREAKRAAKDDHKVSTEREKAASKGESYQAVMERKTKLDEVREKALQEKMKKREEQLAKAEEAKRAEAAGRERKAEEHAKRLASMKEAAQEKDEQTSRKHQDRMQQSAAKRAEKLERIQRRAEQSGRLLQGAAKPTPAKKTLQDLLKEAVDDKKENKKKRMSRVALTMEKQAQEYLKSKPETPEPKGIRASKPLLKLKPILQSGRLAQGRGAVSDLATALGVSEKVGQRALSSESQGQELLYLCNHHGMELLVKILVEDLRQNGGGKMQLLANIGAILSFAVTTSPACLEHFVRAGNLVPCIDIVLAVSEETMEATLPLFVVCLQGLEFLGNTKDCPNEIRNTLYSYIDASGLFHLCDVVITLAPSPCPDDYLPWVYTAVRALLLMIRNGGTAFGGLREQAMAACFRILSNLLLAGRAKPVRTHDAPLPLTASLQYAQTEETGTGDDVPRQGVLCVAFAAFMLLNVIARAQVQLVHAEIKDVYSFEFLHVSVKLVELVCRHSSLIVADGSRAGEGGKTATAAALPPVGSIHGTPVMGDLLNELLLFMGYLTVCNADMQEMFRWGKTSLLYLLCNLPVAYFSGYKHILYPTLALVCMNEEQNKGILKSEVNLDAIADYIKGEVERPSKPKDAAKEKEAASRAPSPPASPEKKQEPDAPQPSPPPAAPSAGEATPKAAPSRKPSEAGSAATSAAEPTAEACMVSMVGKRPLEPHKYFDFARRVPAHLHRSAKVFFEG